MKILLDTHSFLWFVLNDSQLSATAQTLISEPQNDIYISPASYWEITIKISIGKYRLPANYDTWMRDQITINTFEILPILIEHTAILTDLPFHHKDPFDRLIIAQSIFENIPVISADRTFNNYPVTRLW
jgi:PIN domain nuclease of toxin-antitoxin system